MIPHSRPTIDHQNMAAVAAPLACGQVSMGPQVAAFEKEFARKFGLQQAAAVSSGTAALHLALLGLGVGPGDEVIIPTHVCTALLNAVCYVRAKAVLADVNEDGNISVASAKAKLTRRTKAIIAAHMFGVPADMKALIKLGVPVIEDCAQAVGARYNKKFVGAWGKVSIFSFYATKMMTTGEGGMVASADRKAMARVRDLLTYDHKPAYQVRFNYKMTDIQAALGRAQLKQLDAFIARRRDLAGFYDAQLKGLPVMLSAKDPRSSSVHYRYVVQVPGRAAKVIAAMKKHGVCCERPLFKPLHQYLGLKGFPMSEWLMKDSVSLPIYPSLTNAQAKHIVRSFRTVIQL